MSARSLSVSARYSSTYACNPASITPHRFAHAVLGVVHAVLSLLRRMNRRVSSLASHATLKVPEVSAHSHHPNLCVRRGGGGTSFATASRTTLGRDSAISEVLLGWKGREGRLERICSSTGCLQPSSYLNFCRSNGRICFIVRTCLLGAKRPLRRTDAYTSKYDIMV